MLRSTPPTLTIRHKEAALRPWVELSASDNAVLQHLGMPDAEVAALVTKQEQRSLVEYRNRGASAVPRSSYIWGLRACSPDAPPELVGMSSLHHIGEEYSEIGVMIFRSAWLGRGLGRLAFAGMTQLAFNKDARAVGARALEVNTRSLHCLEKVGYVRVPQTDSTLYAYGNGRRSKLVDMMAFNPRRSDTYATESLRGLGMGGVRKSRRAYTAARDRLEIDIQRPKGWFSNLFA